MTYTLKAARTANDDPYGVRKVDVTFDDGYTASFYGVNEQELMAVGQRFFKVLGPDMEPINGGFGRWTLGQWRQESVINACRNGLHLTDAEHMPEWFQRNGSRVFLAEIDGPVLWHGGNKVVAARVRLVEEFPLPSGFAYGHQALAGRTTAYQEELAAINKAAGICFPEALAYQRLFKRAPANTPAWMVTALRKVIRTTAGGGGYNDRRRGFDNVSGRWYNFRRIVVLKNELARLEGKPERVDKDTAAVDNRRRIGEWLSGFLDVSYRGNGLNEFVGTHDPYSTQSIRMLGTHGYKWTPRARSKSVIDQKRVDRYARLSLEFFEAALSVRLLAGNEQDKVKRAFEAWMRGDDVELNTVTEAGKQALMPTRKRRGK